MNVGQLIEDLVQWFIDVVSNVTVFASSALQTLLTFDVLQIEALIQTMLTAALDFSADFITFVVVSGAIAAFAFYFGRNRILPLIAALYASIPLYIFSSLDLSSYGGAVIEITFWFALVFLAFIAFSSLGSYIASVSTTLFNVVILSVAAAGLVLAIAITVIPVQTLYTFSPATLALFNTPQGFYFWLVAPIAALFVFGRG